MTTKQTWRERFDTHFFGTDRSPETNVALESVQVYAVKKFIEIEIKRAKVEEGERIFEAFDKTESGYGLNASSVAPRRIANREEFKQIMRYYLEPSLNQEECNEQ